MSSGSSLRKLKPRPPSSSRREERPRSKRAPSRGWKSWSWQALSRFLKLAWTRGRSPPPPLTWRASRTWGRRTGMWTASISFISLSRYLGKPDAQRQAGQYLCLPQVQPGQLLHWFPLGGCQGVEGIARVGVLLHYPMGHQFLQALRQGQGIALKGGG